MFEQWLTRGDAPALTLARAARIKTGENRWQVEVALRQTSPPYDLQVPVEIQTAIGAERVTLKLDGEQATREVDLRAQPTRLRVDPDYDLFRNLPDSQVPLVMRALTLNPETRLVTAGIAPATAKRFAKRLLDTDVTTLSPAKAKQSEAPLLVVGGSAQVERLMRAHGFGAPPEQVAGQGDLRAWTARSGARIALAVAADAPKQLPRTARVLPYYLRASWLVMQGRRAAGARHLAERRQPARPHARPVAPSAPRAARATPRRAFCASQPRVRTRRSPGQGSARLPDPCGTSGRERSWRADRPEAPLPGTT